METLPSGLPEQVHDDEDLARFLTSRNQFNATMVKPSAFIPHPKNSASVFRHGSEPRDSLWQISDKHLPNARRIYGAAFIKAIQVRKASFDILADEPPPRHADITGWSSLRDPREQKAQQLEDAVPLAQDAKLVKRDKS